MPGIRQRVRDWLGVTKAPAPVQSTAATVSAPRSIPSTPPNLGGKRIDGKRLRVSLDNPSYGFGSGLGALLSPPDHETDWRSWDLDSSTLDVMAPADLLERLCDLSPEISNALWQLLRLLNPGHEVKAYRIGGTGKEEEPRAQAAVEAFLAQLKALYGSTNVVINRLFISAFLRGGFFAELIFDKAGRLPLDLATPDPRHLYFRQVAHPDRGPIWEPYQYIQGRQVSLERPSIGYVPVDPLPGSPYGRALCSPALFITLFALGLMHDLRRVVAQQGYPRLDVEVVLEELVKAMPAGLTGDPEALKRWVNDVIAKVQTEYSQLLPSDAYVHTSAVRINRPIGAINSSSLG